jgi:hypothetical protein
VSDEYVVGSRPDDLLQVLSRAVVEGEPVQLFPEQLARLLLYVDRLETMASEEGGRE